MNVGERVAKIEVKLANVEKLLYVVLVAMALQGGAEFIPGVLAAFGG